ncbi:MAG: polysaccharide pyruvyl transferase family protein [Planctomycetota bacterium]
MYVLLTGARKNAGDYLIAHAARRLFTHYLPNEEIREFPSWLPVDDVLEQINAAAALILCGGPAVQSGLGTRIYPLLSVIDRIQVPIIGLGLGWKCFPGDATDVACARLPAHARPILQRLATDFAITGCRDSATVEVLRNHGVHGAQLLGCPAWFEPRSWDQPLCVPKTINRIVYTPAEAPLFADQSVAVLCWIRNRFPEALITCSFHRGWVVDVHTEALPAASASRIRAAALQLGVECVDISGSVAGLERYDDYDVHIGYRVHAHLRMLALRRPSWLIAEDSRGRGALAAHELPLVCAGRVPSTLAICERALAALGRAGRDSTLALRRAVRRVAPRAFVRRGVVDELERVFDAELVSGYRGMRRALELIAAKRSEFADFLFALPRPPKAGALAAPRESCGATNSPVPTR